MPDVGLRDIVVVYKAKRQRSDPFSLITNHRTVVHVYPAAKIPPSPGQPASCPLRFPRPHSNHPTAPKAEQYVSWLFHHVNKDYIPDPEEFEIHKIQSLNVKNKFCELKDAKDGTFHDIIAQVVQEYYDYGDKIRLYVSDYTENSGFFNHMRTGQTSARSKDGDPYGYITTKDSKSSIWNGPFGKRTLQVTCYEPHATVIRHRVKNGSWVHLLNVQFKYGSNGSNLEGYLREDLNAFRNKKISVDVLDVTEDPEHISPSLKNAIRRKRDYEKEEKALRKDLQSTQTNSKKRPAPGQPEGKSLNSKQKRAAQRAHVNGKAKQDVAPVDAGLNTQVIAEHPGQPITPVSDLLEPVKYETTHQGAPLSFDLPFNCARYRINARVVDFYPNRLQDFARACKQRSEYEALSDYSGEESESEEEEEEEQGTLNGFASKGDQRWEWRFALHLQGVATVPENSKSRKDDSLWVVVTNLDAQLLTDMEACDLRASPEKLAQLRERMFILWGDLEEKKSKKLAEQRKKQKAKVGKKMTGDRPPDSSDNEAPSGPLKKAETISNRPFTCCIHQYGIQVKEPNPGEANAGEGRRWKRMFGLFGTKICYNR
ncbi:telomere-binding alpha subunit central domain-containing protein [Colletotrichum graminicola M1.001]|uniref:Telomere-binding alpha subunit central domain-containing protein n=1 Tax=Colletotrichum graminicola (strain M1.001 / M2 / FGSC 10212) TaxID=645133 RepID=E3QB95_COLGM|nr:telomere-binding alpha subunit central domain-containing protein [Colletotrichum graminicola M1.001]EFQ28133.1 telomere-binding alpha subunit central domain-containing protein [Colletotrichum graminicola M1.001]